MYPHGGWGIFFWTAGYRATTNSAFVWKVTSTDTCSDVVSAMTYTNWGGGQPNDPGNECAALGSVQNYRWADIPCNSFRVCSVCELDI